MASRDEIELKITAKDDASKVVDKLDKKVKDLTKKKAEIGITADDDATKVLADVDSAVDRLDGTRATVQAEAEASEAIASLDDVRTKAEQIDGLKPSVTVEAEATDARSQLDEVFSLVERLDAENAQVVLSIQAAGVQQELGNVLLDIAQINGTPAEIDIKIENANALKGDLDRITGAIQDLDGRRANVVVDADTREAQRALQNIEGSLDDLKAKLKVRQKLDVNMGDFEREMDRAIQNIEEFTDKVRQVGDQRVNLQVDTKVDDSGLRNLKASIEVLRSDFGTLEAAIRQAGDAGGDLDYIDNKLDDIKDSLDSVNTAQSAMTNIGSNARTAAGGLDEIARSADSSKSVLANMVGNATQDLGALGGMAGSVGVAIGQMGEYMVDAANSGDKIGAVLANFAKVAGPIAIIAGLVQAVSGAMAEQKKRAEEAAERTDDFGEAMRDAANDTLGMANSIKANLDPLRDFNAGAELFIGGGFTAAINDAGRALPLLGRIFQDTKIDVVEALSDAGISIYQFTEAVNGSEADIAAFNELLGYMHDAGLITGDQMRATGGALEDYAKSAADAREAQGLFNVDAKEATVILDEVIAKGEPLKQFGDKWKTLFDDMADGSIDTREAADAINFLAENLGLTQEEVISLGQAELDRIMEDAGEAIVEAGEAMEEAKEKAREFAIAVIDANNALKDSELASEAFATALEKINEASDLDFSLMALDTVESFDSMKEAIKGVKEVAVDWASVDLSPDSVEELRGIPDELAAVTSSISGMRDTIQTELQAAFDTGGIQAYTEKAGFFAQEIRTQFPAAFQEMGASEAEASRLTEELLADIGLLPEDIQIMIQLTREEEARNVLAAFASVISTFPDNVQVAINTAIAEGDIEGALEILNSQLIHRGYDPIVLPVDANTEPAAGQVQGFANAEQPAATVPIEGDPAPAEGTIDEVETGTYEATVGVDADTAVAAAIILGFLSMPRKANIYVDLPNANLANSALNTLASNRDSNVAVTTSGVGDADRAINNAARNRTSTITVRTVGGLNRGGTAGPLGGIAGEGTGPEIINGKFLTNGPTYVPPGTRVTSTSRTRRILHVHKHLPRYNQGTSGGNALRALPLGPSKSSVTVNVNAAVVGNRFDVMRAVTRAELDARRVLGSRR